MDKKYIDNEDRTYITKDNEIVNIDDEY